MWLVRTGCIYKKNLRYFGIFTSHIHEYVVNHGKSRRFAFRISSNYHRDAMNEITFDLLR